MAIGKTIKGITVEFNGDTTKLGEALKKIESESEKVDKALRNVNTALKFNPKNTELVTQKQQLLGQKIGQTKDRLQALKDAQAKMDSQGVDKTSQDYMELRREIIQTESRLTHFEGELKKLNEIKFKQLEESVKKVGDKMKAVGDGMTKYVSGPIAGAGAASVAAFKEVDAGMDIVTKKTGATGAALEDMQKRARNLASELPTDFETAGTAIGEVNTRFGLTGDALERLSGQFIQFAKLNGTDVNNAIDMTQKALSAFGLSAQDAGGLLDQLNQVGQGTGVSMETLLQGLVQNGTAFQELGLSAGQAATMMGQLEKSGANSETVMQGLRKALKNATNQGTPLDQALTDLQQTILNGKDGMDGLTASYDLFGKSGDQIYGAVKNGTIDFEALGKASADAAGSVANTFEETLSPTDKFTTAMNGAKEVGYEVGGTLLESVTPALNTLGGYLKRAAEWWGGLDKGTQDMIVKIALLVAAIGPALSIIGRITTGIGGIIGIIPKLITGFKMIGTAFSVVSKLLMANPWMLVAAAAIAAIILIVKNWDKIKEFFAALWDKVKEIFGAAFEIIKTIITTYITAYKTVIMTIFNAIKKYFEFIFGIYKKIFTTAWKILKTIVTKGVSGVKNTVTKGFNAIKQTAANVWNSIRDKTKNAWNRIKEAITGPINKAKEAVKNAIDKIKGFFDFHVSLPNIKLPHFTIHPKGWKLGDLLRGVKPSLGIDWYAKGGIFTSPTIAGVGDVRGGEAALPLKPFWDKMDKIAAAATGGGDDITINIYTQPGQDVRAIAAEVERRITQKQKQKNRVYA